MTDRRQYMKDWYEKNREDQLAKKRAYYERTKDEQLSRQEERYQDPEVRRRHREAEKARRLANPEVYRERDRIRREKSLVVRAKRHIGRCLRCGYDKSIVALQWHHVDPAEKEMLPSKTMRMKDEKAFEELKKCILICANCHWEVESAMWEVSPEAHEESVRLLLEVLNPTQGES